MKIINSPISKFISLTLIITIIAVQLPISDYSYAEEAKSEGAQVSESKQEIPETTDTASQPLPQVIRSDDGDPEPLPPAGPAMNLFGVLQSFRGDPFSGSAMSSIPIAAPPGHIKSGLSLSLDYSSSSQNSVCGVGWSFSIPVIERQTKNGVPKYGANDIFGLSKAGAFQEFIKKSEGKYRFRIEGGFWDIENKGNYWTCTDKQGTIFRFGYNADAREQGGSGVFQWGLDKITDVHGNYYSINYIMDGNKIYPSQIKYTGNDITGLSPKTEITLMWENRPDMFYSYITGIRITTGKRLKSIEIQQDTSLVRRYEFSYTQSPNTKRSLIKTITIIGSDRSSSLPPVRFSYSGGNGRWSSDDARWHAPDEGFIDEGDKYNGRQLIDLNGDGWTDFVIARHDPKEKEERKWLMSTHLNNANGFSLESNWHAVPLGFFIYDYWDDGRRLLDFTRDGKPEEIAASLWDPYYGENGRYKNAYLYKTNWDEDKGPWIEDSSWNLPDDNYFVYGNRIDSGCRFGDLNGDGYTDLIISRTGIRWNYAPLCEVTALNTAYLNTGSGWQRDTRWDIPDGAFVSQGEQFTAKDEGRRLIDINGDGLSDLLIANNGYKVVYLNTGTGWMRDDTWSIPDGDFVDQYGLDYGRWLSDINGDGLTDLLIAKDNYKAVYINTGTGWVRDDTWNMPVDFIDSVFKDQGVRLADLNADGMTDIMKAKGTENKAFLNQAGYPDLLTEVSNNLGAVSNIAYKPSTYYGNTGVDHIHDLPFVMNNVSELIMNDGLGNKYKTTYNYFGGMYDGPTREFRGFGHVWVYDADSNYTETIFYQDELRKGRPYYEKYYDSTGKLLQQKLYAWDIRESDNFVYLTHMDSYTYGEDTSIYKQTQVWNEYDEYGNPVKIINYGDVDDNTDDRSVVTEYIYNSDAWLMGLPKHTSIEDYEGKKVSEKWFYYDYHDSLDAVPEKGLLTKEEVYLDKPQEKHIPTKYTYDEYGNLISTIDVLNQTTTIEYDSTYHQFPEIITNQLGHTQRSKYDPGTGQILESTDPNNQKSSNLYDAFARLKETYGPNDDTNHPGAWYEYDITTSPIKVTAYTREEYNTDEADKIHKAQSFYDGLGRLIQTKSHADNPAKNIISNIVRFNSRGQVQDKYFPYFTDDISDNYTAPVYSGAKISYEYDALGRLIKTKALNEKAEEITSTIEYYLFTRTAIDASGHKTKSYYNAHGELVKAEEFNEEEVYTTNYFYDSVGNLKKTTDDKGNTAMIFYDSLGRKIKMLDPDMGTWSYEYDDLGNLIKQKDAKGQGLEFEYDELNRLKYKKSEAETLVTYLYDEIDKDYCLGRLSKVIDKSGSTEFFYDNLGREIKSIKTIDSEQYTVERAYDGLDRLKAITYPDGEEINYTYTKTGGIKTVTGKEAYVKDVQYSAGGQMVRLEYGNGAVMDYEYSPYTLRMEHLTTNNGALQDLHYTFDNTGNIKTITDSIYTGSQSFGYDDLNRLVLAEGAAYGKRAYRYDSIGNMLEKDGIAYKYGEGSAGPHALTSGDNGLKITYDVNGNMLTKRSQSFEYDIENRLMEVKKDNGELDITEYTFTLDYGWNLISLPLAPDEGEISKIFSGLEIGADYDQVSRYNTEHADFDNYNETEYNQFNTMEYSRGYMVYITNPEGASFTLKGAVNKDVLENDLREGWNLIGMPSTVERTVKQALSNLEEGIDYDKIARYNKDTQLFENLNSEDMLKPGEAYYLHCLKDTAWIIEPFEDVVTSFVYDGDGGRVQKTKHDGGGTAKTIYIGSLYERNEVAAGISLSKHIFLGSTRVCTLTTYDLRLTTNYYHPDHLGSSNIITNNAGELIQRLEYLPYGETNVSTGEDATNYKFTGKELDASTELYYYGARYYDPTIGRFITADSIVQSPYDSQSLNRYSYCRNNPINYIDPTGHSWFSKFFKNIGKAIAGNPGAFIAGLAVGIFTAWAIAPMISSLSGAMAASGAGVTFGEGFILGGMELGIPAFAGSLTSGLASGEKFSTALQNAAIVGGTTFVTAGLIEGSYAAGWQSKLHFNDTRASEIKRYNELKVSNPDGAASYKSAIASKHMKVEMGYAKITGLPSGAGKEATEHWGLKITDKLDGMSGQWEFDWVGKRNPVNWAKLIAGENVSGEVFMNRTAFSRFVEMGSGLEFTSKVYGNIQAHSGSHYYNLKSYTCHEWALEQLN